MLRKFQPCIPTRGTEVPAGPDWLHEIKHDGYRLIVQREGKRVRRLTRPGSDWSVRYPLIVEAALRLRKTSFVIDGEAVVFGPDGMVCTAEDATPMSGRKPSTFSRTIALICATRRGKSGSYGLASF